MTKKTKTVCNGCLYAKWSLTAGGKLHPAGDGRCTWEVPVFVVPRVARFSGDYKWGTPPKLYGGMFINRYLTNFEKTVEPCAAKVPA